MAADLFLTQAEIDNLCHPLTQPAAQVRFLRASGLTVTVKPNGRPAVVRSHAEKVLSGDRPVPPARGVEVPAAEAPKPNVEAFLKIVNGGRNGSQKKAQPA